MNKAGSGVVNIYTRHGAQHNILQFLPTPNSLNVTNREYSNKDRLIIRKININTMFIVKISPPW